MDILGFDKLLILVLVMFIHVSRHHEELRKTVIFLLVQMCVKLSNIWQQLHRDFILCFLIILRFHSRTPLHWAAKRGHKAIVSLLLAHGADTTAVTTKGETPAALCSNGEVHKLFGMGPGGTTVPPECSSDISITPYYVKHQPLNARVDLGISTCIRKNTDTTHTNSTTVISPGVKVGHQAEGSTQNDGK
jgi:hypothetical protein